MSYRKSREREKKLDKLSLYYNVSEENKFYAEINAKNYEAMVNALNDVGVYLKIENNIMHLSIMGSVYLRKKNRNCGQRQRLFYDEEKRKSGDFKTYYRYSDIVYLMSQKPIIEICAETGIPKTTFYRHLKELRESIYYKSVDPERTNDKEYLESLDCNHAF